MAINFAQVIAGSPVPVKRQLVVNSKSVLSHTPLGARVCLIQSAFSVPARKCCVSFALLDFRFVFVEIFLTTEVGLWALGKSHSHNAFRKHTSQCRRCDHLLTLTPWVLGSICWHDVGTLQGGLSRIIDQLSAPCRRPSAQHCCQSMLEYISCNPPYFGDRALRK